VQIISNLANVLLAYRKSTSLKQVKRLRKIRLTSFASIFSNMSDWAKQHLQNGQELHWHTWKKVWAFNILILEYKATRKCNHQCALTTRSFLVFRHMMKALRQLLPKKPSQTLSVVHSEGRF